MFNLTKSSRAKNITKKVEKSLVNIGCNIIGTYSDSPDKSIIIFNHINDKITQSNKITLYFDFNVNYVAKIEIESLLDKVAFKIDVDDCIEEVNIGSSTLYKEPRPHFYSKINKGVGIDSGLKTQKEIHHSFIGEFDLCADSHEKITSRIYLHFINLSVYKKLKNGELDFYSKIILN